MCHQAQEDPRITGVFCKPAWVDEAERGIWGQMKRSRRTQGGGKDKNSSKGERKSIRRSTKSKEKAKTDKRKQRVGRMKRATQEEQI
jgi:hypothetical protein